MPLGEVFLGAFLQVLFDRLVSRELLHIAGKIGLRPELQKWGQTLQLIQAVLSDAEEKQLTNGAVKTWLENLQDLAYDLDDMLDAFATEALRRKLKTQRHSDKVRTLISTCFDNLSPSAIKFNLSIQSNIKGITSRLAVLREGIDLLKLKEIVGGTSTAVWQRPPSTSVPTEPAIYGRHEDKAKILEMVLTDESSHANLGVISIVGMGGIGKTTLAQQVYNDPAVEDFDPKIWVCVSD